MRLLIPITPLFAACTADYEMVNHRPLAPAEAGMILSPSRLVFPEVIEGEAVTRPVTVTNAGSADLWLDGAQIIGEGSFWLASFPEDAIGPGESVELDIGFVPTGVPEVESVLQVFPSDMDIDTGLAELVGTWGSPDLQVWPRSPSFGEQAMGCPSERTLWLVNEGTRALSVSEVMLESEGFTLEDVPELPLVLEPEESVAMVVSFAPVARGAVEGTLMVVSDDLDGPTFTTLSGTGSPEGQCVIIESDGTASGELLIDASYAFADVAFVLDTSGSMGDTLAALRSDVSGIADQLGDTIDDITFGLATYEDYNYGGMGDDEDRPFTLHRIQSAGISALEQALSTVAIHNGLDHTESTIEALYQAAAGLGYDQDCDGAFDAETDVSPLMPHALDAFGGLEEGRLEAGSDRRGGMGFREGVLPIIVFATDDMARNKAMGDLTPGGCSADATLPAMRRALGHIGAGLVGIAVESEPGDEVFSDLLGVVGDRGVLVPWEPDDGGFQDVVVSAIEEMIAAQTLAEIHLEVVEDEYGLVENIAPEQYLNVAANEEVGFSVRYREALPDGMESAWVTFDLVSGDTRLQRTTVEIRVR
jgi:hypothetical protein